MLEIEKTPVHLYIPKHTAAQSYHRPHVHKPKAADLRNLTQGNRLSSGQVAEPSTTGRAESSTTAPANPSAILPNWKYIDARPGASAVGVARKGSVRREEVSASPARHTARARHTALGVIGAASAASQVGVGQAAFGFWFVSEIFVFTVCLLLHSL